MKRMLFAALMAMLVAGCGDDEAEQNGAANGSGAGNGEEPLPAWEGTMSIEVLTAEEIQQLIERHKGQVVVVQFWSTWCEPCKRMLPDLVALQKRLGKQVAAISVNTDSYAGRTETPEELVNQAKPILEQHDARFENVVSATPDEELFRHFDMATNGVIVYDRNGQVVEKFVNPINPDEPVGFSIKKDVEPLAKKLLAERA